MVAPYFETAKNIFVVLFYPEKIFRVGTVLSFVWLKNMS